MFLERLSGYLEASEKLKSKVRAALIYPAVIALVAGGISIFLLYFVIPAFKQIFMEFGAELPLPTQILINLSDFVRAYILAVLAGLILIIVGIKQYYKTDKGSQQIDAFLLKLPLFGTIIRKVAVAKFTRTFGTLVKSGVPILQALDTVAKTSGNRIVEKAVMQARESIREGERIAGPLKASGVFPPMVTQMITVGEETGNLENMLSKIADFYDQEVDVAVEGLTALIEPVVIVGMGIAIGAIVIAMYMPLFQMGAMAGQM